MAVATSFSVPNFSGLLFRKGQANTPFSTMIGAKPLTTNHVEFVTGQFYNTESGEQPEISETASLTAPEPEVTTRDQLTNVTQIFHKSVSVSYAKQSNMGTLQGVNVAGQQPNPNDELAFQVARRMEKIAQDIEYTFLNGKYKKAANDSQANMSRGLLTAITSNVLDMGGKPLSYWLVAEGLKCIHDQGAPTDNIVLGVDATTLLQLNLDAQENNLTIVPDGREINGLKIRLLLRRLAWLQWQCSTRFQKERRHCLIRQLCPLFISLYPARAISSWNCSQRPAQEKRIRFSVRLAWTMALNG